MRGPVVPSKRALPSQVRPNTGSGRILTMPEPKTKHFMRLLVQLAKGTA